MSVTGHTAGLRHPDDFYKTPAWATAAIVDACGLDAAAKTGGAAFDPASGDGAILDVFKARGMRTHGYEIDAGRTAAAVAKGHVVTEWDALSPDPWPIVDVIAANPPFSLAPQFFHRIGEAVYADRASVGVLLLRIAFMAGQGRALLHAKFPSDVHVLPRRPEFAASLKCAAKVKADRCGWAALLPIDAPRPECCECGAPRSVVTSDSADYAWFAITKGGGGRWYRL